jgi:hypothetical protein
VLQQQARVGDEKVQTGSASLLPIKQPESLEKTENGSEENSLSYDEAMFKGLNILAEELFGIVQSVENFSDVYSPPASRAEGQQSPQWTTWSQMTWSQEIFVSA